MNMKVELLPPMRQSDLDALLAAERERCARMADEFIERTNADIAHAIAAAIRTLD